MGLKKTSYYINTDKSAACSDFLAGKRLAVLADLHDRDHRPVLDILRRDIPDAIMIPGDVVHGYYPNGNDYVIDKSLNVKAALEQCSDIAPTYMSVGNHESLFCTTDYDKLRATGVTLLDNEWTELKLRNGRAHDADAAETAGKVYVGGLTSGHTLNYNKFRDEYNRRNGAEKGSEGYERYPYRRRPKDLDDTPPESAWLDDFEQLDGYKVLMSHHPEYWCMKEPMLRGRKIDLVLSGHAHGGQWQFMGRGLFAPGQGLFPQYTSGVHQGRYGSLVISRGLSNPYRFLPRIGNPCEVVYVEFV